VSIAVVYDTMVFLQAAVQSTRVHRSLHAIRTSEVQLCLSPELLAEVRDVLTRPKTRARFSSLTEQVAAMFIADVESRAALYQNVPKAFSWSMHPDDDHLFNLLAIHAKARYLVTWEGNETFDASDGENAVSGSAEAISAGSINYYAGNARRGTQFDCAAIEKFSAGGE
jgi:putative PIN family toxin of toxin-antitoxin system